MFTINNPKDIDDPLAWGGVKFVIFQKEKGAEETAHFQGYVMFLGTKTLSAVKKVNPRAHWENRKGTHLQAKKYCSKDDTRVEGPWQRGEDPSPGKRTDILRLKEAADEGKTEKEIATNEELFPLWMHNFKGLERYKRLISIHERNWPTHSVVYWGPPGVGKTRRVLIEAGPNAYWLKKPGRNQTVFFDGYDAQENVVIDEFYGWLPFDLLCRMCDRYPLMVDTKGGMVNFFPKKIFFTSNIPPNEWYVSIDVRRVEALTRRLSPPLGEVVHMEHEWVPEPMEEIPIVASVNAQLDGVNPALMGEVIEVVPRDTGERAVASSSAQLPGILGVVSAEDSESVSSIRLGGGRKRRRVYDSDLSGSE